MHFECGAAPELVGVLEPASCTYQLSIAAPQLCEHPGVRSVHLRSMVLRLCQIASMLSATCGAVLMNGIALFAHLTRHCVA